MNKERECYPRIHFTPKTGWMNDPNGLVWHDGIFEMYYQSNPWGIDWDNMSWGHARSRDLIHWEHEETAMYPDEHGMMYSGSGIKVSREIASGILREKDEKENGTESVGYVNLPEEVLLFIYTAAYSEPDYPHTPHMTIRLAYSIDGGKTLHKKSGRLLNEVSGVNRDPKVFWHEQSGSYVLVLWIRGNEFGIWRSEDMRWFKQASTVQLESGFECPDLFCLSVSDEDGKALFEKQWVFWAADGSYYIGSFDGYSFNQTQERRRAYCTELPYAAQTWYGVPDGRIISIPWLKTKCICKTYTGTMGLPRELSLVKKENAYVLKQVLAEEIRNARKKIADRISQGEVRILEDAAIDVEFYGRADFTMEFTGEGEHILVSVSYNAKRSCLSVTCNEVTEFIRLGWREEAENVEIIYDRGILEISANDGLITGAADLPSLRCEVCRKICLHGKAKADISIIL